MSDVEAAELPEVPPALVEAATSGHLVVLVGAGASKDAGLPDWQGLLLMLVEQARGEASTEQERQELQEVEGWCKKWELLEAASYLRQKKGPAWIAGSIAKAFRSRDTRPTIVHEALAALPGTAFITTNYDTLLEQALEKQHGQPCRIALASEVEAIRDLSAGQVLKLHGDVERGEIVLSVEDFFHMSHRTPGAWRERLKSFLQGQHRLLLVGYSYSDVDIHEVVNELRGAYEESNHRPFWLTRRELKAATRATAYGLELIWLKGHQWVAPWLRKLAQAIEVSKAQSPALVKAVAYAGALQGKFNGELERARQLFETQEFEQAQETYKQILRELEALPELVREEDDFKRLAVLCRANEAYCLLCMQRGAEALPLFQRLADHDLKLMSPEHRAALAEGLAQLGDLDRSRLVLSELEDRPAVQEARQLLRILEGQLPEEEQWASPVLAFHGIRLLLKQGRLDEASRMGLRLLNQEEGDKLTTFLTVGCVLGALDRSIWEDSRAARWVPATERGALLEAIEKGLNFLDRQKLSSSLRHDLERAKHLYYVMVYDTERAEEARKKSEDSVEKPAEPPPPEHPWLVSLRHIEKLQRQGNDSQALQEAQDLARLMPGRAPVEYAAAWLLRRASRHEEALVHARAAFEALPGWGQRLMLAECLLSMGEMEETAKVLEPLRDSERPRVLHARARAMEQAHPDQALELWRKYMTQRPDDLKVWLRIPSLLFQMGNPRGAADTAWEAFQKGREQYEPQQLYRCAQFQQVGGSFDEAARERVREVLTVLETRFPGSLEGEQYRFQLLTALGFPEAAKPLDHEGLVRAGLLQAVPITELEEQLQSKLQIQENASQLYRRGLLSFNAMCKLTGTPPAVFLMEFLLQAATETGRLSLSPPVATGEGSPLSGLSGQRVLAGELEILLLQHLGLLKRLRAALGEEGRLLIFQDVWEELAEKAAELAQSTQYVELEKLEELHGVLPEFRAKLFISDDSRSQGELEWARQKGLALMGQGSPGDGGEWLSPRSVAKLLFEKGRIQLSQWERLDQWLVHEAQPRPIPGAVLPRELAIAAGPLQLFFEAGALRALVEAVPGKLWIGPATRELLLRRRSELRAFRSAAELAAAAHQVVAAGRTEGWVEVIRRPDAPELPDAPEPERTLVRAPLIDALRYHQTLAEDTNCWLLSADAYTALPLRSLSNYPGALAWMSQGALGQLLSHTRATMDRVLHIPMVARMLLSGESLNLVLEKLAKLGFVDAMEGGEIIDLFMRYGGQGDGAPQHVLKRMTWMAGVSEHVLRSAAGLRLANVSASALWRLFGGHRNQDLMRARALGAVLLENAERLDRETSSGCLRLLLALACLTLFDRWRETLVDVPERKAFVPSRETNAGKLVSFIADWTGRDGRRRAAYRHALRHVWVDLDRHELREAHLRARFVALSLALKTADEKSLMDPGVEALTIVSANWPPEILEKEIEEPIQTWADSLKAQDPLMLNEASMAFPRLGEKFYERVAAEAVLLRGSPDVVSKWAPELAKFQGVHDGRAYPMLMRLAAEPTRKDLRRAYARMSAVAPWRLVREDPAIIASWGWQGSMGARFFPKDVDDLCELLSEPSVEVLDALLSKQSPREILDERLEQGGFWYPREDVLMLAEQVSNVPGLLPVMPLHIFIKDGEYERRVEDSLARLAHPEQHPVARLAGDILFLRLGAARRPYVRLAQGETDLRRLLPERLHHVLSATCKLNQSKSGTSLAECEAGLLRLCAKIVKDLAAPALLPFRVWLWLSYRFFQWLCAQLESLTPDARQAALLVFRDFLPPTSDLTSEEMDLLDPFSFGPERFEHRLATVLYAFSIMEEVLSVLPASGDTIQEPPQGVSSTKLEDLLLEIASRPLTQAELALRSRGWKLSCLDWEGPGAVPDLAFKALLDMNEEALLRMAPEIRLRWLRELPRSPEDPGRLAWQLAPRVWNAFIRLSPRLSAEEKHTLEGYLRALDPAISPEARAARWLGLTFLFGAGLNHLEEHVASLLEENLGEERAPNVFGLYLTALSEQAPERMEREARRFLAKVQEAGGDPVPFAEGVGRVLIFGSKSGAATARALLLELTAKPPFQGHERMDWLLGTLGIR